MANIAYIITTPLINKYNQIECLKKYQIDVWFKEYLSSIKDTNRPELKNLLEFVREGDTVYVHDFSRLARSTKDLLCIVEKLTAKNVHLVSSKENIDGSTPSGKLMLTMIRAIVEFEQTNLLERQREGIDIAKRNGKYKGRKEISIPDDTWNELYDQYMSRKISKKRMAELLDISRPTLNKLLKEKELLKKGENSR